MIALSLLFAAAWKGSLLVALVLVVTRVLRQRMPPRWAHALLLVAIVRLLLPFAPASPVSIFNLARERDPRVELRAVAGDALDSAPVVMRAPVTPPAPDPRFPWQPIVLALWLGGAAIAMSRMAAGWLRTRSIVRDATPIAAWSETALLLEESRARMGVRRAIVIASTARLESPAMHGLLRPTLLLPHGFAESFKVEQLRFVFLHELAHVRRFDVLVNWIAAVAAALHWFNPLVRIAVSRLAEERELACDALALEHLASSERSAYGGTLLRILEQWRLAPAVPGLVGMTSANQHVKRRIQMIATFRSESRRALWIALVAALSLVSLTDATAGDHRKVVRHVEKLSPEAEAVMQRLDAPVSLVLTSVSLSELTNAVSGASGVTITAAEDAIDSTVRDAKFTAKAENAPAHIVLIESLSAVGLGLQFTATGAQIVKADDTVPPAGPVIRRAPHAANGEEKDRVVFFEKHVVKSGDGAVEPAPAIAPADGHVKLRRHINVQMEKASDGVTRRKVTFRGSEGGQVDGTFELEVTHAAASSAH